MLQLIQQIPGPLFMLLIIAYTILVNYLFRIYIRNLDEKMVYKPVTEKDLSAKDILVLRTEGKVDQLIQLIVMDLWHRGFLKLDIAARLYAVTDADISGLSVGEKKMVNYFSTPKKIKRAMKEKELTWFYEAIVRDCTDKLKRLNLLKNNDILKQQTFIKRLVIASILILSLIKFYLGIINNKSVILLGFYMAIILLFGAFISIKTMTPMGKQLLKQLQQRYEWAKKPKRNETYIPNDADPMMAAAVFGVTALAFFPDYGGFFETYKQNSTDYSASGCTSCSTSSDSSDSSGSSGSDSGSGCGGGGCGGGGCGGCGGD